MTTDNCEVTVEQLDAMRKDRVLHVLMDVRESDEYKIAKIEGSILMPMSIIAAKGVDALPPDMPRGCPIIVHCHHGMRSAQVGQWLVTLGYSEVFNLIGGIDKWSTDIDPTVSRY